MGFTCALMGNALGLITGDYGVWWREGGNRGRQQMRGRREEQRLDAELHSRWVVGDRSWLFRAAGGEDSQRAV